MKRKELRLTILAIVFTLFGLTACKNKDEDVTKIITPTPDITKVITNTDSSKNLEDPKSPTYVPESLLTFLEHSIIKGDVLNSFSSILSDKELSTDEINNLSKDNVVGEYVDMVIASTGTVLQVDADNDGVQDLFFWIKDGGTMGNSSRYLLKGNTDGSYTMTEATYAEITQELAFIDFEGKNYLLQTTFDYNNKIINGFEVSCFINGTVHERIFLSKDAVDYTAIINLMDKSLESVAKSCEMIGLEQYVYHVRYDDYIVQGSAEKLMKKDELTEDELKDYADENSYSLNNDVFYGADIDNDGKEEFYHKDIFFTSTLGMVTHLQYVIYNMMGRDMIQTCLDEITGYPQMFWVEPSEEGNIVCILSLDNLLDYTIYGYNITMDKEKEVFRVTFTCEMEIYRTRYTTGINLEGEKW